MRKLWYAVNGSGQGVVFTSRPIREDKRKVWLGEVVGLYCRLVMQMESEGFKLPPLKWSDEPKEIELNLKIIDNV